MDNLEVIKKRGSLVKDLIVNNIDEILLMIEKNISYSEIAKKFGVSVGHLCDVLNSTEYRGRKQLALEVASYIQINQAQQYLESIDESDNHAIVRKKSELSQFATYLAKVKNRKEFDLNYKDESKENNNNIVISPSPEVLELLNINKNNKNQ